MLRHWYTRVPEDPVSDVLNLIEESNRVQIVNGIREESMDFPYPFTPIQMCFSWDDLSTIRKTLEELLLCGADINLLSLRGSNGLHLVLLSFFYRKNVTMFLELLEWFLSKGVNVNVPCFIKMSTDVDIVSPIDLWVLLSTNKMDICPFFHFPSSMVYRAYHNVSRDIFYRVLVLLLLHGSTPISTTKQIRDLLDSDNFSIKTLFHNFPALMSEYATVRFKFPAGLDIKDIKKRINFLFSFKDTINHDAIVKTRKLFYLSTSDDCSYLNPQLEDEAELMLYEYVHYKEKTGHRFFFHKIMVPILFQTQKNPLTKQTIDKQILRQWFHQMSDSPRHFCQVFLLRDILNPSISMETLDKWVPEYLENIRLDIFPFEHIYHIISLAYPYTRILEVSTMSHRELSYVCHMLSISPFHFHQFGSYCLCRDIKVFLWKTILHYLWQPCDFQEKRWHDLGYGLEECVHDIECYRFICHTMNQRKNKEWYKASFHHVILQDTTIMDFMSEHNGYADLGIFYEIWCRCIFLEKFF